MQLLHITLSVYVFVRTKNVRCVRCVFSTLSLQKCFCDCDDRQSDYCRIYQSFSHACYTSIKLSINLIKLTDNKGLLQARLKNKIRMVKIKQIIQKALSIPSHTSGLFSTIHKNDQFRDKIGEIRRKAINLASL